MVSQNLNSGSPIYKHGAAAATGKSSDATIEANVAASSSGASQTVQKGSAPDEDVKDDIVDDPNVIAEVKLPENTC